ncbi:MAG: hypothetical protein P8Y97_09515 [Candidatus Lokiarchaeota archaeon]
MTFEFFNTNIEFPENFIERMIHFSKNGNEFNSKLLGRSTYHEYSEQEVWNEDFLDDIHIIGEEILDFISCCENLEKKSYYHKKILSLDIETTTWIPKAKEGFVNILGISVLDLKECNPLEPELILHQSFNMLRDKDQACHLIHLAQDHLENADVILVFNERFDINILNTIIDNFCIDYQFPETIIDLNKYYRSLAKLEQYLARQVNFKRINSEKGQYLEYYKLFKGKGSKGIGKEIEPIGSYNSLELQ